MYDYFNKTFWEKVDAYGHERMKRDVEELRFRRKKLTSQPPPKIGKPRTISTEEKDLRRQLFEHGRLNYNNETLVEGILKNFV